MSRRLALAGASGSSVTRLEAAPPGTALRGCSGNAAGSPRLRELGVSRSGSAGRSLSSWQSECDGSFCSACQGRVGRAESGNDLFLFSANHKHPLFSLGIQGIVGVFIRHIVCSVGENGAVLGVQRCLSTLEEIGISCFSYIIWLQAVDGTPQKQILVSLLFLVT